MHLKRLIIWSIIGTGITSVATQLLTIREYLSQFDGNEITISLVLFCWLLLTGLGSLSAKAVKGRSVTAYAVLSLIIAVWPLLQMVGIRSFRGIFLTHGVAPGFYEIFLYITVTVAPYCLLTGFILPHALCVLTSNHYAFDTGDLYLTDSIGDIAGGMLFSFFLVYWLKPFATIAVTSLMLLLSALVLLMKGRRYMLLLASLVMVCVFYYYCMDGTFEKNTLSGQYGKVADYVESPYGRIVVTTEGPQRTFWESGTPLYSDSDVIASEEKVHYPLCQLNRLEDVLLVSGGLGETLVEVSKYNPKRIDYVELDPRLTREALRLGVIKAAPNLRIINTDGRRFIKNTDRKYDAIVIDLPDPDTFQINRFFTSEFFRLTKKALKKGGILSVGMTYSQNYISEIRRKKLSTLYNTARLHFGNVVVLPGNKAYFLCRDGKISADIPARLKIISVKTNYIEGFFYGNVTEERIASLKESMDTTEFVNTDFEPRLMNIVFKEWFAKHGDPYMYFFYVIGGLVVVYLLFLKREEYVLFSTGLATMGAEMLVIFAFQVIYGYIYLQIGAIVTAFLLGLLPGAVIGNAPWSKGATKLFLSELFILCLLFIFLIWVTWFKFEIHPLGFLAYCFLFALACGFQFPVAAGIIGEKNRPAAGCFAADLCGASVGTIATGTVLIPLFGIQFAALFLILVKVSSGIGIIFGRKAR